MAETFQILFNRLNPPEGIREGEMLNEGLARLRRILMSEIEVYGVKAVVIQENGSVLQDGDLVGRIAAIPLLKQGKSNLYYLSKKAPSDDYLQIYSDDIITRAGQASSFAPGILITYLPPGESIHIDIITKKGSVLSTGSVHFSPITKVSFKPIDEQDLLFEVELVRGYTQEDFDGFYDEAIKKMKAKGGARSGSTRKDNDLTGLKIREDYERKKVGNPVDYDNDISHD